MPVLDEADGMLLLHLVAVEHAQAAKDAERCLFLEAVAVGAVLIGQTHQLRRIRRMRHQLLDDHAAYLIDLLRTRAHDQALLHRIEAGRHVVRPAARLYFHQAQAAAAVVLDLLVVA